MTVAEARGRAVVYARSEGACEVCGRRAHTVHHRVKRGQGGTWDPANLLHVCGDGTRYCHGWIEGHPAAALSLGLWVRAGVDPATVPAYVKPAQLLRGWWLLDSEGCFTDCDVPPPEHPETPARLAAVDALARGRQIVIPLPFPGTV